MAGILSKDIGSTPAQVTHSAGVRSFDEAQRIRRLYGNKGVVPRTAAF